MWRWTCRLKVSQGAKSLRPEGSYCQVASKFTALKLRRHVRLFAVGEGYCNSPASLHPELFDTQMRWCTLYKVAYAAMHTCRLVIGPPVIPTPQLPAQHRAIVAIPHYFCIRSLTLRSVRSLTASAWSRICEGRGSFKDSHTFKSLLGSLNQRLLVLGHACGSPLPLIAKRRDTNSPRRCTTY